MEQSSDAVVLEYQRANNLGGAYWHGTVRRKEMKFVRVITGVAVPQLERQDGSAIVLGELHRSYAPAEFTGLAAAVGSWPEVKKDLVEFCQTLKPDHIIAENQESRQTLWRIPGLENGLRECPVLTYEAPTSALTEVGRQNVQQLIDEGRLHIEHLLDVMNHEPAQSDKALRFAVNYALEFTAFYSGGPKRKPLEPKLFGTEGL